jgi:hypothetical protein
MALNSSGPISLAGSTSGQSIALELNQSATGQISLNDTVVRTLAGISTGEISLSSFYGKSSAPGWGYLYLANVNTSPFNNIAEKVTYATNTYSSAGINVSQIVSNAQRLSDTSKAILVGGVTGGGTSKRDTVYGIYFATATSFAVANQELLRGGAVTARTTNIGYLFQGMSADDVLTSSTLWNMTTLTQSTSDTILLAPDFQAYGSGSETKNYATAAGAQTAPGNIIENRHVFSTATRQLSTSSTNLGFGIISNWRSLTKNYYLSQIYGQYTYRGLSLDNSTTTWTAIASLALTFAGDANYTPMNRNGGTEKHGIANDTSVYFMGAYRTHLSVVAYTLGYRTTFATNTWISGITRNVAYPTDNATCMGVDPFFEPTA